MSLCSFEGASGQFYDYRTVDFKNRAAFPMGGGNYVFARHSARGIEVVCAGEADNMWSVFVSATLWDRAKRNYGATTPYIRPNPDRNARKSESLDIVKRYHPPMNMDLANEKSA